MLDLSLEHAARSELRGDGCGNLKGLTGLRVAAGACRTLDGGEGAEADEGGLLAGCDGFADGLEGCVDNTAHSSARLASLFGDDGDEVGLVRE